MLMALSKECSSITQIGLKSPDTTTILEGLFENVRPELSFLGIDAEKPCDADLNLYRHLAQTGGVKFTCWFVDP